MLVGRPTHGEAIPAGRGTDTSWGPAADEDHEDHHGRKSGEAIRYRPLGTRAGLPLPLPVPGRGSEHPQLHAATRANAAGQRAGQQPKTPSPLGRAHRYTPTADPGGYGVERGTRGRCRARSVLRRLHACAARLSLTTSSGLRNRPSQSLRCQGTRSPEGPSLPERPLCCVLGFRRCTPRPTARTWNTARYIHTVQTPLVSRAAAPGYSAMPLFAARGARAHGRVLPRRHNHARS